MTRSERKAAKALEARVGKLAARATSGRPILLLDIPRVFEVGKKAALEGKDDAGVEAACVAFIETVRVDVRTPGGAS